MAMLVSVMQSSGSTILLALNSVAQILPAGTARKRAGAGYSSLMDIPDRVNRELISAIRSALADHADPGRAAGAQAYMKSELPSLGVRVPDVRRIAADAAAGLPFESADQLRATVLELWRTSTVREERYAAIDLTGNRMVARDLHMLPVYEEIIRTGAWWDFVDGVAGTDLRPAAGPSG